MAEIKSNHSLDSAFTNFLYRGEGNANLVIAHLTDKVVIRFRKRSSKSDLPADGGYSRVSREVHFAKKVLQKLLSHYVNVPEIEYYNCKDLDELCAVIYDSRPAIRRTKSVLEPFATKLPDYTLRLNEACNKLLESSSNSTFCVEIKPKQGYICQADRKFPKCPFCVKQFLKAQSSSKKRISNYCPFDLFSGDEQRMKKAILNLIGNPQNNFKIFKNGVCCFDQDSSQNDLRDSLWELFDCDNAEVLAALLIKCLLHPFHGTDYCKIPNTLASGGQVNLKVHPRIEPQLTQQLAAILDEKCQSCDFYYNTLPEGCVLERIRQMQKLHQHGDDVVYAIYTKYYDSICDNLIHANVINTFENVINFTSKPNSYHNDVKTKLYKSISEQYFKQITPSQWELGILQNYLLFSTAKDCSVMICFQRVDDACALKLCDATTVIELSKDHKYTVNLNVTDVDLKHMQCIERHYKRDRDIASAVLSTFSLKASKM